MWDTLVSGVQHFCRFLRPLCAASPVALPFVSSPRWPPILYSKFFSLNLARFEGQNTLEIIS